MGRRTRWGTIAAGSAGLLVAGALVAPGTALALPSGCAQPQPGGPVTCTYGFTGGQQTFTPPAGVDTVDVVAIGGSGGSAVVVGLINPGGRAAEVRGTLTGLTGGPLTVRVR